jgi:putative hydrolase of the HAD superfamily
MTFLFDVGKVLLDFDFEKSLENLLAGPDERAKLDRLLADKDAFERGDIPVDAYIRQALAALDPSITADRFIAAWRAIFIPNLPMWQTVERLATEGHRLFLFSNTNSIHCPWFLENFEVFRHFQGGTYSFEVGAIKPEPAIYQAAIARHELVPTQTCYIDDLPANIATGRRFGLRCHTYDLAAHATFEEWLDRQLAEAGHD